MSNTKKNFVSISMITFGLIFAVGCGQKIGGTYVLTQQGQQAQSLNCSQINLNLTTLSNNQVQATGSNGTCSETLTGTDNGNGSITVTSLTMMNPQSYMSNGYGNQNYGNQNYGGQSSACVYSGILNVSGNTVSGMLTSTNTGSSGYGYSYCGTLNITGTRN